LGKTPYEKMRTIFTLMEEDDIAPTYDQGKQFGDVKEDLKKIGFQPKKQEWFWVKLIHDRLKDKFDYNLDRTSIRDILETCCDNDDKLVERRKAIIEPIAKEEFRLTDAGKDYLKKMNDPNYLLNKLNK